VEALLVWTSIVARAEIVDKTEVLAFLSPRRSSQILAWQPSLAQGSNSGCKRIRLAGIGRTDCSRPAEIQRWIDGPWPRPGPEAQPGPTRRPESVCDLAHRGLQVVLDSHLLDQAELGFEIVDVLLGVRQDLGQDLP
jgi:hypothetical protein